MRGISYLTLDQANPEALMVLLNEPLIRRHLIEHEPFDHGRLMQWVSDKLMIDRTPGCKIRAVTHQGRLAGWCGIQKEQGEYEIAIVLGDAFWGLGREVFRDLMEWAGELGHHEVLIHLLETRREYRFLKKLASVVQQTTIADRQFTTYRLPVA
ncbi:GNAT family N-acetyltransferase [Sedimenticola sp.]|uniref:GNAT family N-acetyltransferase n=1 Tax=Sedimenticola sp. TaxID=1940285 RepID=UPI003D109DB9